MKPEVDAFFYQDKKACQLFKKLINQLAALPIQVKTRKSQKMLVLCHKRNFAYVTLELENTEGFRLVFSLTEPLDSPRIVKRTGPNRERYSHHVLVCEAAAVDQELIDWLTQAHQLAG